MSTNNYRVAIIGAGSIVRDGHIPNFESIPNARIEALCDVNFARVQALAEANGIPHIFTDYAEMLHEIKPDITVVAVPNIFHKPMTIAALEAGSHVLCEKPLALSAADAQEMLDLAASKDLTLSVGTHFRWSNPVQAAKAHVDAGFFGEIYAARTVWHRRSGIPGFGSWFTNNDFSGGGSLLDIGIHALDRALYLMGFPKPVTVSGASFTKFGNRGMGLGGWGSDISNADSEVRFDVDDLSWAFVRFENGSVLQFQVAWAAHFPDQFFTEIYGTEGGAFVGSQEKVELYKEMNGRQVTINSPIPSRGNSYRSALSNFVRHLDGDATAEIIRPAQSLTSVRIIEGIQRSAQSGEEVKIEALS